MAWAWRKLRMLNALASRCQHRRGDGVKKQESAGLSGGRRCASALLLLIGLSLGGCASLAPGYVRPALPIPEHFERSGSLDATTGVNPTSPAAGIAWQDYFTDPRLRALIEQALASNRDLRAALLRVEEARAAYGIQRADRLPTIGAAFDATRARVPADLNVTRKPVLGNQIQLGVGLSSWELDLWGRVRDLNDAALQSYLATDAARRAATLSLVAQVANAYLGLSELDERLVLARRAAASRNESLRIFRRRVELGATSRLELTQVELLWQQASVLVAQLEQSRAVQVHAMALLVGTAPQLPPSLGRIEDQAVLAPLEPGLASALLLNRPDIVAAEHGLKAAHANIGAARATFFPRITLTSAFGTASAELDGLFDSGSRAWTLAPSIALPIFDGGRRRAALDLAEVRREQSVLRYEQAVQAAFRDVSDALAARRWFGEQVEIVRATLAVQTERARLAKLRYDSGAARYLEVLDAERDLLGVQQQLVQTQRAWLSAQVALYTALGGGSQQIAPQLGASAPRPE